MDVWKISKGAVDCGFVTDVSHVAVGSHETGVKLTGVIEVDVGHFQCFSKLVLSVVTTEECRWMWVRYPIILAFPMPRASALRYTFSQLSHDKSLFGFKVCLMLLSVQLQLIWQLSWI